MTGPSMKSSVTAVLLSAFVATASVTACGRTGEPPPAGVNVNLKNVNADGWTIVTDRNGAAVCREHRRHGALDDDGKKPAVIHYDAATGKVTGEEHWRNGKRAEPPLPFAPGL